jgi:hypothetical protein
MMAYCSPPLTGIIGRKAIMLKRIVWTLAAGLSFGGAAAAQNDFAIGSAVITAPVGWSEAKKEKDRVVLRSPDGRQQATISILRFDADGSFDDFKRLCADRIEAEKRGRLRMASFSQVLRSRMQARLGCFSLAERRERDVFFQVISR